MKSLNFKDLRIGMHVEVDYSGSKYFVGGGAWSTGSFNGHVEGLAVDWISIRDSNGRARVATDKACAKHARKYQQCQRCTPPDPSR